jgi:hypothetical protein
MNNIYNCTSYLVEKQFNSPVSSFKSDLRAASVDVFLL